MCGLHGGAGTTTVTAALAVAAAARSLAAGVLAVEADPGAAELAHRLGAASPWTLAQLAAMAAVGQRPDGIAFAEREDGLRVLAAASPNPIASEESGVPAVLAEARRAHALVVLDSGPLHARVASACLPTADVVLWVARADRLEWAVERLRSPLARPARAARWALVVVGGRASRKAVRAVRDDVHARVALPADLDRRAGRADSLLDLVRDLAP